MEKMVESFRKIFLFYMLVSLFSYSNENKVMIKYDSFGIEVEIDIENSKGVKKLLKFTDKDSIFFRELNYYEKFNPNFTEIKLSEKEKIKISRSKNKKLEYKKILEKIYLNESEKKEDPIDYYIINKVPRNEKIVTKTGKLIDYTFREIYSSENFYIIREAQIDKKIFDENFNKVLDGKNIEIYNSIFESSIRNSEKKEKNIKIIEGNIEPIKSVAIMYCNFQKDKYKVCEKINLDSEKVKIIKHFDYIEVKINENEGFYIVENFRIPITRYNKETMYRYTDYISYGELKFKMSEFYYFLKLLKDSTY